MSFLSQVKRQQRKVNFLITLPELYAHFMKNKMGTSEGFDDDTNSILRQLEDDVDGPCPTTTIDDYDRYILTMIIYYIFHKNLGYITSKLPFIVK